MKSIKITTVIILILTINVKAQVINYDYDNNGNRISRVIFLIKSLADNRPKDSLAIAQSFTNQQVKQSDNAVFETFDKAKITLYPNPTSSKITISMDNVSEQKIHAKIVSATGSLLKEAEISRQHKREMDLSGYSNGQYYLVLTQNEKSITWIIIKN